MYGNLKRDFRIKKKGGRMRMKKYMFGVLFLITLLIGAIKIGDTTNASPVDKSWCKYYTNLKIEAGDTLSDIAHNLYNNPEYDNQLCWDSYKDLMDEIVKMNNLSSENLIHAGNYIAIPYVIAEN